MGQRKKLVLVGEDFFPSRATSHLANFPQKYKFLAMVPIRYCVIPFRGAVGQETVNNFPGQFLPRPHHAQPNNCQIEWQEKNPYGHFSVKVHNVKFF